MQYDSKGKPSRYSLGQHRGVSAIDCKSISTDTTYGVVLKNTTDVISNWSLAEEIKRLIRINTVIPVQKDYVFHRDSCTEADKTPFANKTFFYCRGKSTSNSTKYQCKECKKITNVLPTLRECYNYNQKSDNVIIQITKDLLGKAPVSRTCKKLNISPPTYYNTLEQIYKRCLHFLEKHETTAFQQKNFNEIWVNTDSLIFNLNNIRKKGMARADDKELKDEKNLSIEPQDTRLQTYLIASGDLKSNYVFRADIAYDYDITLEDIERDTPIYHCDHTYSFLRKNERLRFPYCPQPPSSIDDQTDFEYKNELLRFNNRKKYVEGCHVKAGYTAMAHYWLIKNMINSKEWRFVSDDDGSLQNAIFRIFSDKFTDGYAQYFTCQIEKSLSLTDSGKEYYKFRNLIKNWSKNNGLRNLSYEDIAFQWLSKELKSHDFYNYVTSNGKNFPVRGSNPIRHPLAFKDEGIRYVNCISNITDYSVEDLTELLMQVNNRTTNGFFQQIRRRLNLLERPIVGARGDGKSYIYANYNPRYGQYVTTILRTFYNFCWATKIDNKSLTPAQRIGITDKIFDYDDIIYFR